MKPKNTKLTVKQRKFVAEYIKCGIATEAAIKAGYSKKTARFVASENLTKPHIQKFIENKMKEIETSKIADATEVLQFMTKVLRGEEEETVIVTTAESVEKLKKEADIKTKLIAAKELLKRFPATNDELQKAIIDKAKADAEISRYKANLLQGSDDNERVVIIDDID